MSNPDCGNGYWNFKKCDNVYGRCRFTRYSGLFTYPVCIENITEELCRKLSAENCYDCSEAVMFNKEIQDLDPDSVGYYWLKNSYKAQYVWQNPVLKQLSSPNNQDCGMVISSEGYNQILNKCEFNCSNWDLVSCSDNPNDRCLTPGGNRIPEGGAIYEMYNGKITLFDCVAGQNLPGFLCVRLRVQKACPAGITLGAVDDVCMCLHSDGSVSPTLS
jgi:hypothetical protein